MPNATMSPGDREEALWMIQVILNQPLSIDEKIQVIKYWVLECRDGLRDPRDSIYLAPLLNGPTAHLTLLVRSLQDQIAQVEEGAHIIADRLTRIAKAQAEEREKRYGCGDITW